MLQRAEDEQVRQALDRGCDRETIAEVFGIVSRTTWHKEKRANAYGFPLEAVSRAGETGEDAGSGSPQQADTPKQPDQQQLDRVAAMSDGVSGNGSTEPADDVIDDDGHESVTSPDEAALEAQLATAIDALQSVEEALISD